MTRRNLCPVPTAKFSIGPGGGARWYCGGAGSARVTAQVGFPAGVTTGYLSTGTSDAVAPRGAVVPGRTYTDSAYVLPRVSGDATVQINWYRDGAWFRSEPDAVFPVVASTVSRVHYTATAPAGADEMLLLVERKPGDMVVSCVLYEDGSLLQPYFDGDSPGASWDAANGESTSTMTTVSGSLSVPADRPLVGWSALEAEAQTSSRSPVPRDHRRLRFAGQDARIRILGEGPVLDPPQEPPEPVWVVYARDAQLRRVAQLDDYTKLTMIRRFNDVGTWELQLHRGAPGADALAAQGAGIIVTRDGVQFLSGPVSKRRRVRRAGVDSFTVSGVDDMVWLQRRLARPQPLTPAPPYNTAEHDVRTGVASTVLRQYVDVNAGPGALAYRRVPLVALAADPLLGSAITGRARWQKLLVLLQELAVAGGGLRFGIEQDTSGAGEQLLFSVSEPLDRSESVKFSEGLANLAGFDYSDEAPEVTYVVIGAGGEGTARIINEGQDAVGIANWGLIEDFKDRRDTSDTAEIEQEIATVLAEGAETITLELEPVDRSQQRFGQHYDLGDRVSAVVDGAVVSEIVREVRVELAPGEPQSLVPVLGTPSRLELLRLIGAVRDLAARTRNLERR